MELNHYNGEPQGVYKLPYEREQERERVDHNQLSAFHADLQRAMSTDWGRRILISLLERCGVFRSIMVTNAFIYYQAGQQDLGHWLLDHCLESDEGRAKELITSRGNPYEPFASGGPRGHRKPKGGRK